MASATSFLRDRKLGTVERISVSTFGFQGNQTSTSCDTSYDGRYVVMISHATELRFRRHQ
jgi:hypothetical protein